MAALDVTELLSWENGITGLLACKPEDHEHLAEDVLRFFDHTTNTEAPTSSSSDGSGSSARGEGASTTPPHSASVQQQHTSLSGGSASGASWVQMAPQLAAATTHHHSAPSAATTLLYSVNNDNTATQSQSYWPGHGSVWHPAFSTEATVQQTSKESKNTVSHSTIEKQRRDRINSLIDELRDLVPPSAAVRGPDGGDIKRPKHVVLSDTIALLRHLKDRVQQDELERQRMHLLQQQMAASGMAATADHHVAAAAAGPTMMPVATMSPLTSASMEGSVAAAPSAQSAQSLLHTSLSGSLTAQTAAAATAAVCGTNSCPELPQAPSNLPSAVGVLVEEGPGSFLVKVNCRDRHGLLSDITHALGNLPLQITRAAITTSDGGAVYDVFEIIAEPSASHEAVTALDVQYHVHQALYKWKSANPSAAAACTPAAVGKRARV